MASVMDVPLVFILCTGGPRYMREIRTQKIGSHIMNLHVKRPCSITINQRIGSRKKAIFQSHKCDKKTAYNEGRLYFIRRQACKNIALPIYWKIGTKNVHKMVYWLLSRLYCFSFFNWNLNSKLDQVSSSIDAMMMENKDLKVFHEKIVDFLLL